MRVLVWLILGAAAGFAVGRLTAPEGRGRGGGRGASPVVAERQEPSATPIAPEAPASDLPTKGVVQPAGPIENAEDDQYGVIDGPSEWGLVEIAFGPGDGKPEAWAGSRTIRGGYEAFSVTPDEGEQAVLFHLQAGTYDVWWLDDAGRRRGTRAAVENGKCTRIRAADYRVPGPIPEGLGVLELGVAVTWAAGARVEGTISRDNDQTLFFTNDRGYASETLLPGRYVVEVGDHREEAEVAAGRVTTRRIAHGNEGDLILDLADPLPRELALARPGERLTEREVWTGNVAGVGRCGLLYVSAGEYDVAWTQGAIVVPLGRAVVEAGRMTQLHCQLPSGGLSLRVVVPAATTWTVWVSVERIVEGEATGRMLLQEDGVQGEATFKTALPPGRYAVTASAGELRSRRVEIDIADRMVDASLDLDQGR